MKVYKLEAVDKILCEDGTATEEAMLIGFFDSGATCSAVIDECRKLPGFSLPSCNFSMKPYVLNSAPAPDQASFFYLQICAVNPDGDDTVLEDGLYLSRGEAEAAKDKYLNSSKYSSAHTDEYVEVYVEEYRLNDRHWTEGFDRYTW